MPLFDVDIEKRLNSEFWTNRYIVNADSLGTAIGIAQIIVSAEQEFHGTPVTFTRYRVASTVVGDGVYTVQPIGQQGARALPGQLLPLFNTLRMDFNAVSGRPSRKYYRGVLTEDDINGDTVNTGNFVGGAGSITALFTTVEEPQGIVDPQGERLVATVVWPFVQMRQLRRSKRRRNSGTGIFQ